MRGAAIAELCIFIACTALFLGYHVWLFFLRSLVPLERENYFNIYSSSHKSRLDESIGAVLMAPHRWHVNSCDVHDERHTALSPLPCSPSSGSITMWGGASSSYGKLCDVPLARDQLVPCLMLLMMHQSDFISPGCRTSVVLQSFLYCARGVWSEDIVDDHQQSDALQTYAIQTLRWVPGSN